MGNFDIKDEDLQRLLKLRDADLSFFVLAMHSLIEKNLRLHFDISPLDHDKSITFDLLFYDWINELKSSKYVDNLSHFYDMINLHKSTNDVRHWFSDSLDDEFTCSVVSCFCTIVREMNFSNLPSMNKIKSMLNNWYNYKSEGSEKIASLQKNIKELREQNQNLVADANRVMELEKELEKLNYHLKAVESDLDSTNQKYKDQKQKMDLARQERFEKQQEYNKRIKEIQNQLNGYEETKKYLDYLTQISFYTKTRHDYEKSIIRVTAEQKKILDSINLHNDFLIKGAAGTGKSFVLLKALEKCVKENTDMFSEGKISFRLLTYTKSLVKYNKYVSSLLCDAIPDGVVSTADSFLWHTLKKIFPDVSCSFQKKDFYDLVEPNDKFSPEQVLNEAEEFVWANCITKEEYIDQKIERTGMGLPLKRNRAKMWKLISDLENKLKHNNLWPKCFAAKMICEAIENGIDNIEDILTEYSFIDEGQDLPTVVLKLIKMMTKNSVMLCGDNDQSIYRNGFSYKRSGISVSGRTRILKTNFRNTIQIHEFAENYRAKLKSKDTSLNPEAFRPGPPVELTFGKNTEELENKMLETVQLLMTALRYEPENICIIARDNKILLKMGTLLQKNLNLESHIISNDDFDFKDSHGVRLTTMQSCKGLDFPVVLLLADHRPVTQISQSSNQLWDEETLEVQHRNMIYVSMTRAMEMLHVFRLENPNSKALQDLCF